MLLNPPCIAIMGARSNSRRGGGGKPKKGPHHEVKVAKRPPHGEKAPKNEKT